MPDDKAIQPLAPLTHSIKEARRLTGLSKNYFWKLEAQGRIRLARIGRRTLVPHSELERLIREGQEAA